jgi:hypothetical protein
VMKSLVMRCVTSALTVGTIVIVVGAGHKF